MASILAVDGVSLLLLITAFAVEEFWAFHVTA